MGMLHFFCIILISSCCSADLPKHVTRNGSKYFEIFFNDIKETYSYRVVMSMKTETEDVVRIANIYIPGIINEDLKDLDMFKDIPDIFSDSSDPKINQKRLYFYNDITMSFDDIESISITEISDDNGSDINEIGTFILNNYETTFFKRQDLETTCYVVNGKGGCQAEGDVPCTLKFEEEFMRIDLDS